ncbi:MAG: hypothetical protein COA57_06060 [Flavobacteriales bacterium]|nr:MAG: hypothetical protein COA57_06060 [Flavobacteriales bacterium]
MILACVISYAQVDTTINGLKYGIIQKYETGELKKIGLLNKKKNKVISWKQLDVNGQVFESGNYSSPQKQGKWWINKREFYIYNEGKIASKGSGCKKCPEM